MRDFKFAIDCDGVLYDHIEAVQRRLDLRWNMRIPRGEIFLPSPTGIREVDTDILDCFLKRPEFYRDMKLFPGAAEAVAELRRYGKIMAISGRPVHPTSIRAVTIECLTRDFGDLFDDDITQQTMCVFDRNKAKVAKMMGVRVAFDDDSEKALAYTKRSIRCYLIRSHLTKPYRRNRFIREAPSLASAITSYLQFAGGKAA